MWSDLWQCLKENISWIHLKFVPDPHFNPNEGLFLSRPGYTHFVAITVFSVKMGAIPSSPKHFFLSKIGKEKGSGHGKAMAVIVNVRTHLLELSEVC